MTSTENKKDRYSFKYTPTAVLSPNLGSFLWGIIKRNPILWILMNVADVIHYSRFPLFFLFLGICIDELTKAQATHIIPDKVLLFSSLMAAVLFIGELAHVLSEYYCFNRYLRPVLKPQIRAELLTYALNHSYNYLQSNFSGFLMKRITGIADKVLELDESRESVFAAIIYFSFTTVGLLSMHYIYSLIIFIFFAAFVVILCFKLRRIHHLSEFFSESQAQVAGSIGDSLTNAASVKSFARNGYELLKHDKVSSEENRAGFTFSMRTWQLKNIMRSILVGLPSTMFFFCIYGWKAGWVSVGDVAAIMGMTISTAEQVWSLGTGLERMTSQLGYISDGLKTLIVPHEIQDKNGGKELKVSHAKIEFKNVGFSYNENNVFKKINLVINPQQHLGLIGYSGAGKSTLISLLLRYFEVQEGGIYIDGQNIAEITQDSLRNNIGIIPQDTSLFHRSLMENIRYGDVNATDASVIEAAKKAHAHDFIKDLPNGYHTLVGERGVKLSGGQRQRIAIARAILKDAPILILDEATSALDSESEKLIQAGLKTLMQGKTVIAIAHRLSTIAHLNRLIVLGNGEIIEDGTHEELLKQKGSYQKLWNMQSSGFLGA